MKNISKVIMVLSLVLFIGLVNPVVSNAQPMGGSTAKVISLNDSVVDQLESSDTQKYYKFIIDEKGYFNLGFDVNYENAKDGWTLTIMDSKYNQIYKAEKIVKSIETPAVAFEKGEYLVKIEAGWNYNERVPVGLNYELAVQFTPSSNWEIEANNSYETANLIGLDTNYTGTLYKSSDLDYYKFKIDKNGFFNVFFDVASENPQYGWNIIILDSKMNVIYKKDKIKASVETPNFAFKPGDYYIKVVSGWDYGDYTPVNQKYNVKVSFSNVTNWESEYNDTAKIANKIKVNAEYTGSLYKGSDKDYYEVMLTKSASYVLDLSYIAENVSYGWTVKILDKNMKEIQNFSQIKTQFESKVFKLQKGTYYVVVEAGWDYGDYYPTNIPYKITLKSK